MGPAWLAVLGPLDDWVPRSATAVAVVAGPLVLAGYLVGAIPFGFLLSRRRLRRQLSRVDPRRLPPRAGAKGIDVPGTALAAVLSGAATLAATTVAWDVAAAATPGASRFSAVAAFSNQVLGAWVSVALWTGAAAVAGHLGSVFLGFRGGSGVPPATALALAYAPLLFAACATAFVVLGATRRNTATALPACLPLAVVVEYGLWLSDTQVGWGVTNGPELALWTTVVVGMLLARHLRPRS